MTKRSNIPKRSSTPKIDCIIVGAGMAGLACARELNAQGKTVLILEGRDRIGGRILTARDTAHSLPVELGAEFIHGAPEVTFSRLEAAGLTFYDLTDKHLYRRGSKLQPMEFFDKMQDVMNSLDANRKTDRSVDEFLKSKKALDPDVEKLTRAYVEGFHAADTHLIGERALALAEKGGADLNGVESFRTVEGYDRLAAAMLQSSKAATTEIRLNTIVKKIAWKKSHVTVECVSSAGFKLPRVVAKTIVVTVPLGVLKAPPKSKAAIEFSPVPKGFEKALNSLHMGHAMRLNLRFRTRFWEEGHAEPIGFLHAGSEYDFPTWWTMAPLRTPILTAWQGGPKVEELSKLTDAERVQTALSTLAVILDREIEFLQEQLESWYFHDWSNDPFSFGAYSYVGLDGDKKAKALSEDFSETLFFAGEATHTSHERGTVDGAIDTGLRAARQVLKAL